MATYNGADFIEEQIQSIISQLTPKDELIIIDDHSSDHTPKILSRICSPAIKYFYNDRNLGASKTFERAIQLASKDIIFLSDQDDIWHPNKVSIFKEFFCFNPDVTLLLSDARIIDGTGSIIEKSFFSLRGQFRSGLVHNFVKNKFLGCTIAFRQSLVDKILPFPNSIPQHDIWIGCIAEIYGKTAYLTDALVDYRRHDRNLSAASVNRRSSILQILIWRWQLLKNLVIRFYLLRGR
jgi:glycosyltransferase involved in cell wall biosynthesis